MGKRSCNCLPWFYPTPYFPVHFKFPVIPAWEINNNSGKIASPGTTVLNFRIYRSLWKSDKRYGPCPIRNAKMHKQNLVRNFRGHGPQEVNGFQLSSLDLMERKRHTFNWPSFPTPLYLGWESSSTECEASRGMHMEHWGREGTPAQSDTSAKIILTSNGVTDVD